MVNSTTGGFIAVAFGLCDTGGDVMKETLKPSEAWTDVPPSDMVWCIRNMMMI